MTQVDDKVPTWPKHSDAVEVALRELPCYCLRQRWYPAKDAGVPRVSLRLLVPLDDVDAALVLLDVAVEGGDSFSVFVPLAVELTEDASATVSKIIGKLADGRTLIDATHSDDFIKCLVQIMLQQGQNDPLLQAGHTEQISALGDTPVSQWHIERSSGEQSNTSVRIADRSMLKILRKAAPGMHPELEMSRFLTEVAHFRATPALLGWLSLDGCTVAILQEYIPNEGDGWTWSRTQLQAGTAGTHRLKEWLRTLGRRTAEMHAALQVPEAEAAFRAETTQGSDWQRWAEDLTAMAGKVQESLETSRSKLDADTQRLAVEFAASAGALQHWLTAFLSSPPTWQKTRHHGDYHLGQVLVSGNEAVIVDFEGEPLLPLNERRAKHVPLRDVAGMLRSIEYVSATLERELPTTLSADERSQQCARLTTWTADASRDFVHQYLETLEGESSHEADRSAARRVIQFFVLEKALYEVLYELSNRPAWTSVPLRHVLSQLGHMSPRSTHGAGIGRHHDMPFGAQLQKGGGVRFRFWAPENSDISLCIRAADGSVERIAKMALLEDGWHELVDTAARAGTLYDYLLPDGTHVPDPASRFQPRDVHGPSEVIDPTDFLWSDSWKGRGWAEAVIYELHVGSFTRDGTFRAAIEKLDLLMDLGITAIELMPIADFPGRRNWGYDGVFWYAPDSCYGRPEDLKALVEAAHSRGIMVFLDVVYNHFGPDGNFLPAYAPSFFTDRHKTPWGAAVNYDGARSHAVREFVIHNALYWLDEFNLDGLRFDAVHAILDDGPRHLLEELAQRVRVGRSRPIHLILENEENSARWLSRDAGAVPLHFSAQWNDDVHHVLHVAATGETQGYYADYADGTEKLARALAEGFAFQGETMPFSGRARGEKSSALPPPAFVAFIQNHDQIGNRAFGDRVIQVATPQALRAIAAVYLLLPQIPMIFMGEEWGSRQPFPFFCDFDGALGEAVRKGRREEFSKFPEFQNEATREKIPDPQAQSTFLSAKLQWDERDAPQHRAWLDFYQRLLTVRRASVIPILGEIRRGGHFEVLGEGAVAVNWALEAGGSLRLEANLSDTPVKGFEAVPEGVIWTEGGVERSEFSPWCVRWSLQSRPTI